jgi:hypothetical protein
MAGVVAYTSRIASERVSGGVAGRCWRIHPHMRLQAAGGVMAWRAGVVAWPPRVCEREVLRVAAWRGHCRIPTRLRAIGCQGWRPGVVVEKAIRPGSHLRAGGVLVGKPALVSWRVLLHVPVE